jgi:hypothetical protein
VTGFFALDRTIPRGIAFAMAAATAWKEPYIHVSLHASVQMDNEHDSKLICYNNPG